MSLRQSPPPALCSPPTLNPPPSYSSLKRPMIVNYGLFGRDWRRLRPTSVTDRRRQQDASDIRHGRLNTKCRWRSSAPWYMTHCRRSRCRSPAAAAAAAADTVAIYVTPDGRAGDAGSPAAMRWLISAIRAFHIGTSLSATASVLRRAGDEDQLV